MDGLRDNVPFEVTDIFERIGLDSDQLFQGRSTESFERERDEGMGEAELGERVSLLDGLSEINRWN